MAMVNYKYCNYDTCGIVLLVNAVQNLKNITYPGDLF